METSGTLPLKDWEAPQLDILPKLHTINNPGRLTDSFIGYHSTNISKFVDYDLQLIVKNIQACHFVRNVRN